MSLRERLKQLVTISGIQTPDWQSPAWNNPAGYEFNDAKHAMEAAYLKLLDIEAEIDAAIQSNLSDELGPQYGAGGALKTQARFASEEWLAAWHEYLSTVK